MTFLENKKTRIDLLDILECIFDHLKKYPKRLYYNKCVFEVTLDFFLGLIISRKGIEENPNKLEVFLEMPPPRNLKQLCSLQGKLESIQ